MSAVTGSAGSLVGAILESVGYHYQAVILDEFTAPFTNELGGLIYLLAIGMAVVMTATQGKYQLGIWLLIGPPVFFAVIQPRDTIPNAKWEFAKQPRDQAKVDEETEALVSTLAEANVSKVFQRFVHMVGRSSQEIVKKIVDNRDQSDLWFVMKGELYAMMHTGQLDDPDLKRLMHLSLLGYCGEVIQLGRSVNDPLFRKTFNPAYREIKATKGAIEAEKYFQATHEQAEDIYKIKYDEAGVSVDEEGATYLNKKYPDLGVGNTPKDKIKDLTDQDKINNIKEKSFTCRQIWEYTIAGIDDHAKRTAAELLRKGAENDISPEAIRNAAGQAVGMPGEGPIVLDKDGNFGSVAAENIRRLIARYYLRNEVRDQSKAAWLGRFVTRHEQRNVSTRLMGRNSYTEMSRLGANEWGEKERLMHAAGNLPYYQGLVLFFLGATFPFWALLLLIPGKQGGFLLWFSLWIWVKSWDIGMAVVMLLDDLIFAMLSVQQQSIWDQAGGKVAELNYAREDMGFAMETIREMDPTFQLSTYYTIIATAVLAIPPTSAQLILGSLRSGATLIAKGMNTSAEFYGSLAVKGAEQVGISAGQFQARKLQISMGNQYAKNLRKGRPLGSGLKDEGGAPITPGGSNPVGGGYGRNAGKNKSLGSTNAEVQARLNQQSAQQGRGQGRNDTGRDTGVTGGFVKAYTARSRVLTAAQRSGAQQYARQDLKAAAHHGMWDAMQTRQAEDIYEKVALLGGIPIPWSSFVEESSKEEFSLALSSFAYEADVEKASYETFSQQASAVREILKSVMSSEAEAGKLEGKNYSQIMSMLKPGDPRRAEIRNRTLQYMQLHNKLHRAGEIAAAGSLTAQQLSQLTKEEKDKYLQKTRYWSDITLMLHGPEEDKNKFIGLVPVTSNDAGERLASQKKGVEDMTSGGGGGKE